MAHINLPNSKRARLNETKSILDLDDACLIHAFSLLNPLPDLFNAARACTRFRDLVHTRRSWLVVAHDIVGVPQQYRQHFTTLAAAVRASKPGDTIILEPGTPHVACGIVITHPLHIIGGGACPEDCILTDTNLLDSARPTQYQTILSFASTGRVSNITVNGGIAGCIAHCKGRLQIEDANLKCHAKGLRHLAAPIVSFISSSKLGRGLGGTAEAQKCELDQEKVESGRKEEAEISEVEFGHQIEPSCCDFANEKEATSCLMDEEQEESIHQKERCRLPVELQRPETTALEVLSSGPGLLSVVNSVCEGGGTAVRLCGTGELRSVRVIYEAHKVLFWFEVEASGNSNLVTGEGGKCGEKSDIESEAGPSWVRQKSGEGMNFDPAALQAHVAACLTK